MKFSFSKFFTQSLLCALCFIFIATPAAAQTFSWAGSIGSINPEVVTAVGVDGTGDVYFTGNFQGTCDLDPTAGGTSNFVAVGGQDFCNFLNQLTNQLFNNEKFNCKKTDFQDLCSF